jgi:hypothetical protein
MFWSPCKQSPTFPLRSAEPPAGTCSSENALWPCRILDFLIDFHSSNLDSALCFECASSREDAIVPFRPSPRLRISTAKHYVNSVMIFLFALVRRVAEAGRTFANVIGSFLMSLVLVANYEAKLTVVILSYMTVTFLVLSSYSVPVRRFWCGVMVGLCCFGMLCLVSLLVTWCLSWWRFSPIFFLTVSRFHRLLSDFSVEG